MSLATVTRDSEEEGEGGGVRKERKGRIGAGGGEEGEREERIEDEGRGEEKGG